MILRLVLRKNHNFMAANAVLTWTANKVSRRWTARVLRALCEVCEKRPQNILRELKSSLGPEHDRQMPSWSPW